MKGKIALIALMLISIMLEGIGAWGVYSEPLNSENGTKYLDLINGTQEYYYSFGIQNKGGEGNLTFKINLTSEIAELEITETEIIVPYGINYDIPIHITIPNGTQINDTFDIQWIVENLNSAKIDPDAQGLTAPIKVGSKSEKFKVRIIEQPTPEIPQDEQNQTQNETQQNETEPQQQTPQSSGGGSSGGGSGGYYTPPKAKAETQEETIKQDSEVSETSESSEQEETTIGTPDEQTQEQTEEQEKPTNTTTRNILTYGGIALFVALLIVGSIIGITKAKANKGAVGYD